MPTAEATLTEPETVETPTPEVPRGTTEPIKEVAEVKKKDSVLLGAGDADEVGDPDEPDTDESEDADADPIEYKIELPDGMTLDKAALDRFTPLFQGMKADQETVQKLVNEYIEVRRADADAQMEQFEGQRVSWLKQVKSDPELGGKNWQQTNTNVGLAMREYFPPELRDAFRPADPATGRQAGILYFLQTYPPLIAAMNKIGADLQQGKFVPSSKDGGAKSKDQVLRDFFPNSPEMFANQK